jgi:hypothetical protein
MSLAAIWRENRDSLDAKVVTAAAEWLRAKVKSKQYSTIALLSTQIEADILNGFLPDSRWVGLLRGPPTLAERSPHTC